MAEDDHPAGQGLERVVPPGPVEAARGGPGADGEELVARGAGVAPLRVDAGVDQQEPLPLDRQRRPLQPRQQLVAHGPQGLEGAALIRAPEADLAAGAVLAELRHQAVVVVAEDHLRAGVEQDLPDPQRVRPAGEGVAG